MRPIAKMLLLAALLAVVASVTGNVAAGGGGPQARAARSQPAAYEAVLLREINQVRAQRGLPELRPSGRLATAAEHHSRRMAERGFFDHNSPNGSPFWRRVGRFYPSRGFNQWSVGENLAYGSPSLSAEGTVRAWMGSPGHRANLLSAAWREIGLAAAHTASAPGVYGGRKTTIVTADFGIRR
jgi:uncharacterized protein YkwD